MRHHLTVKGDLDTDEVRKWLLRPLRRLGRQLVRFPHDATRLRTLVREVGGRPGCEASLTLQLPSKTLAVSEEGRDPRSALAHAFLELERQLKKEKARLRRAHAWRRSTEAFRRELLDRVASQGGRGLSEAASELLGRHLHRLEAFVRRELHWLELSGDLVPGEIDPRDVVDAAFEQALARGKGHPTQQHLLKSASSALRAELARARESREQVHIEEDVSDLPPERAVSTLGGEILDFYQPDDELLMQDLVAGLARTPEESEATAELMEIVRNALATLPATWRQGLHLAQVERLDPLVIADVLEVQKEAVPELLARARTFLRDRLVEAGVFASAGTDDAP